MKKQLTPLTPHDQFFGLYDKVFEISEVQPPLPPHVTAENWRLRLNAVLKTLPYREREIIKLRFGLGDGFCYTLEEIGHIFKVSGKRISQCLAKAIYHLQQSNRAQELLMIGKFLKEG